MMQPSTFGNAIVMLEGAVLDLWTYCQSAGHAAHPAQSGNLRLSKRDPTTWYIGGKGDRHVATSFVSVTDIFLSHR